MKNSEYDFLKKSIKGYLVATNVDYALLLSGKWGCGKTYLINEVINECDKDTNVNKICYVSLNGVATIDVLKTRLILSLGLSRRSRWFQWSRWARGGKTLVSSCISLFDNIPWVALLSRAFVGIKQLILDGNIIKRSLVLDDIERSGINIEELFGFLRVYQEETKVPIVLIGDENKIKTTLGDFKKYSEIKEKTIGRTLVKHARVDDIIGDVIKEQYVLEGDRCKDEMAKNCCAIFNFFKESEDENGKTYENLRAFKIAVRESFSYLNNIEQKYKEESNFYVRFFKVSVALKYAIQIGRFTKENWDEKIQGDTNSQFPTTIVERFLKTLKEESFELASMYPILSLRLWKNLLFGEVVDWDEINDFIGQTCEPFKQDDAEPYEKLISFDSMSKDEIEKNIQLLNKKIENREIVEMCEIFRAFSSRVSLLSIREKVYAEDIEQQLSQLRIELEQYVNDLLENRKLKIDDKDSYTVGRMFERTPLTRIVESPAIFFVNILRKFTSQEEIGVLHEVLRTMELGDARPFLEKLMNEYSNRIVFKVDGVMNPERMITLFKQLSPPQLQNIRLMFYHRYRFNVSNWKEVLGWCTPEREAFIEMRDLLVHEIDQIKDSDCYRAYNYVRIKDDIEKVIARINELTKDNTVYAE